MARLTSFLRNPFSFLFARNPEEDAVAAYVLREHASGRPLDQVIQDAYVQNRLSTQQQERLLSRPELVQQLGEQAIADARATLSSL
ncbi:MAG: hypothetical protein JOY72_09790 [Actinobacteria bacterium]|nr:hypothetical protein [Actinomycetota bacterium]MBV8480582.1 hypothetical protein [Actinomycetota bacterium]